MNSCPEKNELIAYRLDMLDHKERTLIEEHIAVCRHCRHAMEVESAIDKELSFKMDPGNIEDMVLRKLRVYRELRTRPWWSYPVYVFLNTLAGFGLGFGIWIFISNQFSNRSFSFPALENSAGVYIGIGISIAALLTGFGIAFRKNLTRVIKVL